MFKDYFLRDKQLNILEIAVCFIFCVIPVFVTFPYKINLYLAWDGAYRMSIGQFPFKDFGMPLGYGFWIIPALFFKIFGPFMSSLIKAQVFLNAISLVAVSSIFRTFKVQAPIRVLGITFLCLSYVFVNFWPWYNHTVFVYEIIGLAFLFRGLLYKNKYSFVFIASAGIFIFLSIFTKQDIGGLGLIISLTFLIINNLIEKEFKSTLIFIGALAITATIIILPLLSYQFDYWFNFGQSPHTSRIALFDYLDDGLGEGSLILRIYFIAVLIVVLAKVNQKGFSRFIVDKFNLYFTLFILAILTQVVLAQVTTYIPANAHFYYHSFFFTFLLTQIPQIEVRKTWVFVALLLMICFVWSHDYWRYGKRVMTRAFNIKQEVNHEYVSKRTWKLPEENAPSADRSHWKPTPFKSFDNILLPPETIEGIKNLKQQWAGKKNLKVLNM